MVFSIPDNLVEKGDPTYEIRLKVKVVESCNELRDVCSYIIQNQAFVDFTGEINNNLHWKALVDTFGYQVRSEW